MCPSTNVMHFHISFNIAALARLKYNKIFQYNPFNHEDHHGTDIMLDFTAIT